MPRVNNFVWDFQQTPADNNPPTTSYKWLFVVDHINKLDLGEMLLSSLHLNFRTWAPKLNYSDHKVFFFVVPPFHLVCFPNCLLLRFFSQSCFYLSFTHLKFKSNNLGIKLNLMKKACKRKSFPNRNWLLGIENKVIETYSARRLRLQQPDRYLNCSVEREILQGWTLTESTLLFHLVLLESSRCNWNSHLTSELRQTELTMISENQLRNIQFA